MPTLFGDGRFMKRSSRPRVTSELSRSLHHRLDAYALAASAAGVGLLALAQPAEAKIIYTPAHLVLPGGPTFIDFNHDGISDLMFGKVATTTGAGAYGTSLCICTDKVPWVVDRPGDYGVGDLKAGFRIGPNAEFADSFGRMAEVLFYRGNAYFLGEWAHKGTGTKSRYVGVKFTINGNAHYGWVRFSVYFPNRMKAVLTGYAYETIPNKAIVAGATKGPDVTTVYPASLGHLAAGTSAIPARRVKQAAATTHQP